MLSKMTSEFLVEVIVVIFFYSPRYQANYFMDFSQTTDLRGGCWCVSIVVEIKNDILYSNLGPISRGLVRSNLEIFKNR